MCCALVSAQPTIDAPVEQAKRGRPPGKAPKRAPGRPRLEAPAGGGVWLCEKEGCGRTYVRHRDLLRHLREHANKDAGVSHPCTYVACTRSFMRPDQLRTHIKNDHEFLELRLELELREIDFVQAKQLAQADVVRLGAALHEAIAREAQAQQEVARLEEEKKKLTEAAPVENALDDPEVMDVDAARTDKCQKCKELRCRETGALPHLCYIPACRRKFHSLCARYHFELHPGAIFLCPVCLPHTTISANDVEAAAAELAGLPAALQERHLRVEHIDPDGECLSQATARGTKNSHGDARALMRRMGEAMLKLVAFVETPAATNESADLKEWRRRLWAMNSGDPKKFMRELREGAQRLADGVSTAGCLWDSAAIDVAPLVLPALIGRPVHIWEYSVCMRKFPDEPIECEVMELPGVPACAKAKQPVHLLRTKNAIKRAHYDLLKK